MRRKLRIASSYSCLAVCLFIAGAWVQSYHSLFRMSCMYSRVNNYWIVDSFDGRLATGVFTSDLADRYPNPGWRFRNMTAERLREHRIQRVKELRSDPRFGSNAEKIVYSARQPKRIECERKKLDTRTEMLNISFPHWLPVVVFGLLAIVIRPRPRFGVRLYDLLAVTTIVAAVVGGFGVLLRLAED